MASAPKAAGALREAVASACAEWDEWPDQVAAGLGAAREVAAEEPGMALSLLRDATRVEGGIEVTMEPFARCLRRGRGLRPEREGPPAVTEQFLLAAVAQLLAHRPGDEERAEIEERFAEIAVFVLTPYLGSAEAREVAMRHFGRSAGEGSSSASKGQTGSGGRR